MSRKEYNRRKKEFGDVVTERDGLKTQVNDLNEINRHLKAENVSMDSELRRLRERQLPDFDPRTGKFIKKKKTDA